MLSDPSSPGTPGSDAAADVLAVSAPPQMPGGQPRPLQRQESPGQVGKLTTTALFTMLRSCYRSEDLIEICTISTEGAVPSCQWADLQCAYAWCSQEAHDLLNEPLMQMRAQKKLALTVGCLTKRPPEKASAQQLWAHQPC